MNDRDGVLVLEGGGSESNPIFEGKLFGKIWVASEIRHKINGSAKDKGYGEVVFNTAMTGYQEVLTDPSYYGQIICMTYPHIGNTGVNAEDAESSKAWCSGLVTHELPQLPSSWRSTGALSDFLLEQGIPGIAEVDTRALTRYLRAQGVARGVILPREEAHEGATLLKELPIFEGRDLIKEVTTPKPYLWSAPKEQKFKVIVLDFGVKWNLLRCLERVGCAVNVVPADTAAETILAERPDGLFLSNGPGDPAAATYAIQTVKTMLGKFPIFGVCMGHQILGLALGAKTYKLKFGHRGSNQPVFDRENSCVEISSHNHGYAIDASSLPSKAHIRYLNLNDKTVEGLDLPSCHAFSVQYHPEASPGPHDSLALFERFTKLMRDFHVPKIS